MTPKRKGLPEGEPANPSDSELIESCIAGDREAWEALVSRYQRLIYSLPLKMGLPPEDAADIFQQVCVILIEKLSHLRKHEKLASWLITTTSREAWKISKARRKTQSTDETGEDGEEVQIASGDPLPSEARMLLERQQLVRNAVQALPERCRNLVAMLFYEDKEEKYIDIAQRLGIPVSSVGPTRARCLEKLKRSLEKKI